MIDAAVTETPEIHPLKLRYAKALIMQPDPYAAALLVFPDIPTAIRASRELPGDPEVVEARNALLDKHGLAPFLPTQDELARDVYIRAAQTRDPDSAGKLYKLFAEIRGFISKGGGNTLNAMVNVDNRRVMVVTDHGSDEEWEAKVLAQQTKLIADGANPLPT